MKGRENTLLLRELLSKVSYSCDQATDCQHKSSSWHCRWRLRSHQAWSCCSLECTKLCQAINCFNSLSAFFNSVDVTVWPIANITIQMKGTIVYWIDVSSLSSIYKHNCLMPKTTCFQYLTQGQSGKIIFGNSKDFDICCSRRLKTIYN